MPTICGFPFTCSTEASRPSASFHSARSLASPTSASSSASSSSSSVSSTSLHRSTSSSSSSASSLSKYRETACSNRGQPSSDSIDKFVKTTFTTTTAAAATATLALTPTHSAPVITRPSLHSRDDDESKPQNPVHISTTASTKTLDVNFGGKTTTKLPAWNVFFSSAREATPSEDGHRDELSCRPLFPKCGIDDGG